MTRTKFLQISSDKCWKTAAWILYCPLQHTYTWTDALPKNLKSSPSWLQFSLFWKAHKEPDSQEELTQLIIMNKSSGSVLIFHLKNVMNSEGTPEGAYIGEMKMA